MSVFSLHLMLNENSVFQFAKVENATTPKNNSKHRMKPLGSLNTSQSGDILKPSKVGLNREKSFSIYHLCGD